MSTRPVEAKLHDLKRETPRWWHVITCQPGMKASSVGFDICPPVRDALYLTEPDTGMWYRESSVERHREKTETEDETIRSAALEATTIDAERVHPPPHSETFCPTTLSGTDGAVEYGAVAEITDYLQGGMGKAFLLVSSSIFPLSALLVISVTRTEGNSLTGS